MGGAAGTFGALLHMTMHSSRSPIFFAVGHATQKPAKVMEGIRG